MKRNIGDIFLYEGSYYKITSLPTTDRVLRSSYNVVKCTRYGMEYKYKTSFPASYLETLPDSAFVVSVTNEKANIAEGNKIGAKKRRLKWLEAKINVYQRELADLRDELE